MERNLIVSRLERDLVGPLKTDERLDAKPSDTYLTGILWPRKSRLDAADDERLDSSGTDAGGEDDTQGAGEEVPLAGAQRPCSAGVSFALSAAGRQVIEVVVEFALYEQTPEHTEQSGVQGAAEGERRQSSQDGAAAGHVSPSVRWIRKSYRAQTRINLTDSRGQQPPLDGLPAGVGLHVRSTRHSEVRLVTVTVINDLLPDESESAAFERCIMFQVGLSIRAAEGGALVPKPEAVRGTDEDHAALLYRDSLTFAVGHTCSAEWSVSSNPRIAEEVRVSWLPRFEVPRVQAAGHEVFAALTDNSAGRPLEAQWLGAAARDDLRKGLLSLVERYSEWIERQQARIPGFPPHHAHAAADNLVACVHARDRMRAGVERIVTDDALRTSFQLANRAMQLQHEWNRQRQASGPLRWRPFQLGFVLVAAVSTCEDSNEHRGVLDLLWFPTGGGKTEAYLLLIAMLAFYRRLSADQPDTRAGVAAVMRYTLRLLTTQQFVRAASLILACEAIRRSDERSSGRSARLGRTPFSIGLWLGGQATPNAFDDAAMALAGDRNQPSPEQLISCPCCFSRLKWRADSSRRMIEARCDSPDCEVGRGGTMPLPVWTVDSDVYRERPTLLIGTIDKFAQLPRRKEVEGLFAFNRSDSPDLVIQDELHLISGPLGTIAAAYETAFDWLIARGDRRAKVIGSTATIRRASQQARQLFNRHAMQFPPPGIDHHDSGFAVLDSESAGRLYVGVTTAGRSAKFTLQAVAGCLLQAAFGEVPDPAARDAYSTLVAYFNSLRELGGALVLMQDDVTHSIRLFGGRHAESLRQAGTIEELTSRRTQSEVRDMLDKLMITADQEGSVDVVLATNMVSVGVDVPRLGLMLVNGQPKTRSEYIQATSRVGRDKAPGLVVCLLNNAKPRDRSHYETFPMWHQSLYRDVEATSVTPFASRARDRALHAALTTMVRFRVSAMRDSAAMSDAQFEEASAVIDEIVARAHDVDPSETTVGAELRRRLQEWEARQPSQYWNDYDVSRSLLQSAERAAAQRALGRVVGEAWPTMNNMRSVEPGVRFRLAERLKTHDPEDSGGQGR